MTMKELPPNEPQPCPTQMPVSYFGAHYPDSQCIDGYLWDEDSGDSDGLDIGGDIPCPFCKPEEHTKYMMNNDDDRVVCVECETDLTQIHWAETSKPSVKLYGHCSKCNCNQWGKALDGYEE